MASKKRSASPKTRKSMVLPALHLSSALVFVVGLSIVVFGVCLILKLVLGWHLYFNAHRQLMLAQPVAATGVVHFTALKPDSGDRGQLTIQVKPHHRQQWQDTHLALPLSQDAAWSWSGFLPGVVYDVRAILSIDDSIAKTSEIKTIAAPAAFIELPLEVNWKDLPNDVVAGSTTELGGTVAINGHLPEASTLEMYIFEVDGNNDITVIDENTIAQAQRISSLPASQENYWTWPEATPLHEYEVVAVLRSAGRIIGISDQLITADAGEVALHHQLNSTATPPVTNTQEQSVLGAATPSVSGVVYLQGPEQANTSLLMLWKKPADSDYQVINRYSYPENSGQVWSWDGATTGQQYQITAALQVNEANTSTAPNPQLITAPAKNVNFTLNTWYTIPQSQGEPSLETCLRQDDNHWTAIITVPTMSNAGNYWLQVGTSPNSPSDVFSQKYQAYESNQPTKLRVTVEQGKTNYMKYTYATCVNCRNDQNFAPPSKIVTFSCQ